MREPQARLNVQKEDINAIKELDGIESDQASDRKSISSKSSYQSQDQVDGENQIKSKKYFELSSNKDVYKNKKSS